MSLCLPDDSQILIFRDFLRKKIMESKNVMEFDDIKNLVNDLIKQISDDPALQATYLSLVPEAILSLSTDSETYKKISDDAGIMFFTLNRQLIKDLESSDNLSDTILKIFKKSPPKGSKVDIDSMLLNYQTFDDDGEWEPLLDGEIQEQTLSSDKQKSPLSSTRDETVIDGVNDEKNNRMTGAFLNIRGDLLFKGGTVSGNMVHGNFNTVALYNDAVSSQGVKVTFFKDKEFIKKYGNTHYENENTATNTGVIGVLTNNQGQILTFDNEGNFKGYLKPLSSGSKLNKYKPVIINIRNFEKKDGKWVNVSDKASLLTPVDKTEFAIQQQQMEQIAELRKRLLNGVESETWEITGISQGKINNSINEAKEDISKQTQLQNIINKYHDIEFEFSKHVGFTVSRPGYVSNAKIYQPSLNEVSNEQLKEDLTNLTEWILEDPSRLKVINHQKGLTAEELAETKTDNSGWFNTLKFFRMYFRAYKLENIEQFLKPEKQYRLSTPRIFIDISDKNNKKIDIVYKDKNGIKRIELHEKHENGKPLTLEERKEIINKMIPLIQRIPLNISKDIIENGESFIYPSIETYERSYTGLNDKKQYNGINNIISKDARSRYINDYLTKVGFWTPVSINNFEKGGYNSYITFNKVLSSQGAEDTEKKNEVIEALQGAATTLQLNDEDNTYDSKDGVYRILRQSEVNKLVYETDEEGKGRQWSSLDSMRGVLSTRVGNLTDTIARALISESSKDFNDLENIIEGTRTRQVSENTIYIIPTKTGDIEVEEKIYRNLIEKLQNVLTVFKQEGWDIVTEPMLPFIQKSVGEYQGWGGTIDAMLTRTDENGNVYYTILDFKTITYSYESGKHDISGYRSLEDSPKVVKDKLLKHYTGRVKDRQFAWRSQLFNYKMLTEEFSKTLGEGKNIKISALRVVPFLMVAESNFDEKSIKDFETDRKIPVPLLKDLFNADENDIDHPIDNILTNITKQHEIKTGFNVYNTLHNTFENNELFSYYKSTFDSSFRNHVEKFKDYVSEEYYEENKPLTQKQEEEQKKDPCGNNFTDLDFSLI